MNSQSLRNIISVLLLTCFSSLSSQEGRDQRLYWQYCAWQSNDQWMKDSLELLVADAQLNEGDYTGAFARNNGIRETAENRNMKMFIAGKAEFMHDNYEGSMSFFDALNENALQTRYRRELHFFRTLDQVHLLQREKALEELTLLGLVCNKDTIGIVSELAQLPTPKQFDLRKATRKASWMPGAGLYYIGEKKRALGSFFTSALFLGYTVYSIYTQHYITSVFTGVAQFMRFYNGGKRATFKIADKKNREAYLNYVMKADELVQKKYFELNK